MEIKYTRKGRYFKAEEINNIIRSINASKNMVAHSQGKESDCVIRGLPSDLHYYVNSWIIAPLEKILKVEE